MAKKQTHRCHSRSLFGRLTEKGTAVARAKAGAVAATHGETVGTADVTRVGRGRRRVATARVATWLGINNEKKKGGRGKKGKEPQAR